MTAAKYVKSSQSKKVKVSNPDVSDKLPRLLLASESTPLTIRHYEFKRNWTKRIVPHLADAELNKILVKDFNKFTWGRWRTRFLPGMFPDEVESCYWRCHHRGRHPRYWRYVKHGACHWLANFALRLAMLAEPTRQWRIVTSDKHTAVWDGQSTLFDLQGYSLGGAAEDSWKNLQGGVQLEPGQYMKVHLATHHTKGR